MPLYSLPPGPLVACALPSLAWSILEPDADKEISAVLLLSFQVPKDLSHFPTGLVGPWKGKQRGLWVWKLRAIMGNSRIRDT